MGFKIRLCSAKKVFLKLLYLLLFTISTLSIFCTPFPPKKTTPYYLKSPFLRVLGSCFILCCSISFTTRFQPVESQRDLKVTVPRPVITTLGLKHQFLSGFLKKSLS